MPKGQPSSADHFSAFPGGETTAVLIVAATRPCRCRKVTRAVEKVIASLCRSRGWSLDIERTRDESFRTINEAVAAHAT